MKRNRATGLQVSRGGDKWGQCVRRRGLCGASVTALPPAGGQEMVVEVASCVCKNQRLSVQYSCDGDLPVGVGGG